MSAAAQAPRPREASAPRRFVQLSDAPPAGSAPCGAVLPLYVCTRERGHDGAHVAHELVHPRRPVAVWWDDEPEAAQAPPTLSTIAPTDVVVLEFSPGACGVREGRDVDGKDLQRARKVTVHRNGRAYVVKATACGPGCGGCTDADAPAPVDDDLTDEIVDAIDDLMREHTDGAVTVRVSNARKAVAGLFRRWESSLVAKIGGRS